MKTKPKKSLNSLLIGVILGIIIPLLTIYFFYLIKNLALDFKSYIDYILQYKFASKILSLALISNLAIFFLFITSDRYKSARGVILATFIYALISVLYMFVF